MRRCFPKRLMDPRVAAQTLRSQKTSESNCDHVGGRETRVLGVKKKHPFSSLWWFVLDMNREGPDLHLQEEEPALWLPLQPDF